VLDVQIKNGIIEHLTDRPVEVGSFVYGKIDFTRRFDFMQHHTGEHIFSGLVYKTYGYHNVGFHLSDRTVSMDYDGFLTMDQVRAIEWEANQVIWKNLPVEISWPDKEELDQISYRSKKEISGRLRLVTIPGVDVCACCAPHVRRTGEIGILKVISFQNYKGGTRVSILCGNRAYLYLKKEHDMIGRLALSLSTSWENIPDVFSKQQEEIADLKKRLSDMAEKVLLKEAENLPDGENVCMFAQSGTDPNVARRIVNDLMEKKSGYCGIFIGNDAEGYRFIIGSKNCNCNDLLQEMRKTIQVRGGGAPAMVQGSVSCAGSDIEKVFACI
jgi:alanyl-tRNA synthetase